MKRTLSLIAAVAVLASAQASLGASCAAGHKGGRKALLEPRSAVAVQQAVKTQSKSTTR